MSVVYLKGNAQYCHQLNDWTVLADKDSVLLDIPVIEGFQRGNPRNHKAFELSEYNGHAITG